MVTTLAGIYRLKSGGDGSYDPDTEGGVNWELAPTRAQVDAKAAISGQTFSGNISAPNLSGTNTGDQDLSGIVSLQTADILVTVGTGGDYPTINAALEYLSKLQPVYDSAGITATINLLAGFTMAEQVLVRGLDMGWVSIAGADAETVITHTALTTDFTTADYGYDSYPAFGVSKGGVHPRIDQLFRFDDANVSRYDYKHGIMAVGAGSSADVLAGAGVNDAGTYGIYAKSGSTINAEEANATNAGRSGIYADSGSTIDADRANASGSEYFGIYADSGSTINAYSADASGAGDYGIYAKSGSTINAYAVDASSAGDYGIYAKIGSTINAEGANASSAGTYGIHAGGGSTINAEGANASSAGAVGIYAENGSTINAEEANASSAGAYGIWLSGGSVINASGTTGILSQTANTLTSNGIIFQ